MVLKINKSVSYSNLIALYCIAKKLQLTLTKQNIKQCNATWCNKRAYLYGFAPSLVALWFENDCGAFFWGRSFLERDWGYGIQ